ncbi:MAG: hypothetical protein HOG49_43280 [Candidatus Scalindua sp.]|jgi:hypothetical protein|nr:hypothetical protein [Candidatus Scalindua sp.]
MQLFEIHRDYKRIGIAAVATNQFNLDESDCDNLLRYYNPSAFDNALNEFIMIDSSIKLQNDDVLLNSNDCKIMVGGALFSWDRCYHKSFALKRMEHLKTKAESWSFMIDLLNSLPEGVFA